MCGSLIQVISNYPNHQHQMKNESEDSTTLKDLTVAILAGFAGILAAQLVKNALNPAERITMRDTTRSFVENLLEEGIEGVNNVTKRRIG